MSSLPIEGLEAAMRPERLFPIRTYEGYGFYAGLTADGCQILAAVDGQTLLIVRFDAAGSIVESHWWELAPGEDVEVLLRRQLGWKRALVRVKRFRVPLGPRQPRNPIQLGLVGEDGFAVAPMPLSWQESIDDADDLGSEREDFAAMVQGWVNRGDFALYWGNEYLLNSSGEVVGS
jgi:hypothetical protein